jgi:hypothetical protein
MREFAAVVSRSMFKRQSLSQDASEGLSSSPKGTACSPALGHEIKSRE